MAPMTAGISARRTERKEGRGYACMTTNSSRARATLARHLKGYHFTRIEESAHSFGAPLAGARRPGVPDRLEVGGAVAAHSGGPTTPGPRATLCPLLDPGVEVLGKRDDVVHQVLRAHARQLTEHLAKVPLDPRAEK